MDICIECGAEDAPLGGLYCADCDVETPEMIECSLCGREFDHTHEGEYDTCGECLDEMDDAA